MSTAPSDAFLAKLKELLAAFQEVHQRWAEFWARYRKVSRMSGSPALEWGAFQRAFRTAAVKLKEAREAVPDELAHLWERKSPIPPPNLAPPDCLDPFALDPFAPKFRTWRLLRNLDHFARKFATWLPKITFFCGEPFNMLWFGDLRDFMNGRCPPADGFENWFIKQLAEGIRNYEAFLATRETRDLVLALVSPGGPAEPARPAEPEKPAGDGPEKPAEPAPAAPIGCLGGQELANALGIHPTRRAAFFRQLTRWRLRLGDENWDEPNNRRHKGPRFIYRLDSPKLQELAARYRAPKTD